LAVWLPVSALHSVASFLKDINISNCTVTKGELLLGAVYAGHGFVLGWIVAGFDWSAQGKK
jgi:hypothetical protein